MQFLNQELHDATRETLSNLFRTILKSPLSAKTSLHCLRVLRGAATNYSIQTERRRLRGFVISVKPCTLLRFFCYTQIIYNTNTSCEQHLMFEFP